MAVVGIDSVEFVVESLQEADEYLVAWGLLKTGEGDTARYECADGSSITLVDAARADSRPRPFPTINELTWGISDDDALRTLTETLAASQDVAVAADGTVRTRDAMDLTVAFRVTRKRRLEAAPALFNTPGAPARIDQSAPFYDRAIPQEIGHIVLGVENLAATEDFYRNKLGFHVSDRYVNRGVFLRAPAIGHHHNLFLLDEGKFVFNHLAFKVRDIHEVIGGGQGFVRRGAETLTGPGRHYASSGCFWYFKSPFGGAMEYVADEDVVTPAWQPSDLTPSPERFSEWAFHNGDEMGALKKA